MKGFFKSFVAWAGTFATLVAAYIALSEFDLEWAFFLVLGAAVVFAAVPRAWNRLLRWIVVLRSYPRLLERAASLEKALEGERGRIEDLERHAGSEYERGRDEGAADVRGAVLSELAAPPEIVGVSEDEGGLIILGRQSGEDIPPGARFDLVVAETGEIRGVVQVEDVDPQTDRVRMYCVDRREEAFWARLEDRVIEDPTPPPGVVLVTHLVHWEKAAHPPGLATGQNDEGE